MIILAFILLPPGALGTFRQAPRHRDLDVLPAIHVENVAYRAEDSLKTWRIQNAIAPPHVESLSGGRRLRRVQGSACCHWRMGKGVCVSPTRIPEALVHERGQKDDSRRVGTWRCGLDWKGPRWVLKSR